MDDFDLLQQFRRGSEDAFAALVQRHSAAIYGAALRIAGSPQLAEEIASSVFHDLARSAASIRPGAPLICWLYRVTRRTALDCVKLERRRLARERFAAEQSEIHGPANQPREILATLDDALSRLRPNDRAVILLRYFREESVGEIARALGLSADAAQKRIERAVDRLRQQMVRRGIPATAATLSTVLGEAVSLPMPPHLGAILAKAASAPIPLPACGTLFMTATQKAAVLLVSTGLLGTAIYQQFKLSDARQKLNAAAADLGSARSSISTYELRLKSASDELRELREQNREIYRLRAELTAKNQSTRAEQAAPPSANDSAASTPVRSYLDGIETLKNAFFSEPQQRIPEMSLLNDREWLEAAIVMREAPDHGLEKAMAHLRTLAKGKYSLQINRALQRFVAANAGKLPDAASDLSSFLEQGIDPTGLARYDVIVRGTTSEIGRFQNILRERIRLTDYDSLFNIGMNGSGYAAPPNGSSDRSYGFSYTSDDLPAN